MFRTTNQFLVCWNSWCACGPTRRGMGKTRPARAPTAAPIGENANSEKRTAPIEAVAAGAFMRKGCTAAIALLCSPGILERDPLDGNNNSISIRRSADSTCDMSIAVVKFACFKGSLRILREIPRVWIELQRLLCRPRLPCKVTCGVI